MTLFSENSVLLRKFLVHIFSLEISLIAGCIFCFTSGVLFSLVMILNFLYCAAHESTFSFDISDVFRVSGVSDIRGVAAGGGRWVHSSVRGTRGLELFRNFLTHHLRMIE